VDEDGETLGLTDDALLTLQSYYETAIDMLRAGIRNIMQETP